VKDNPAKKRRAAGRLLPQWPHYLGDEEWLDANQALAFARTRWDKYEHLLSRILDDAKSQGLLLPAEAWALLELFRDGKPAPQGRPPASEEDRAKTNYVAAYSYLREAAGDPTEAAISAAAALYGVQRTKVFEARQQSNVPEDVLERWRTDPAHRERLLNIHKAFAAFFRAKSG
jgi:hypothetical protein